MMPDAGPVVRTKLGGFDVPIGTEGHKLDRAVRNAIDKFATYLMKNGWHIHRMSVRTVPKYVEKFVPVATSRGIVLKNASTGLPPDHPLYKPDCDQYQIIAQVSREREALTIEVPDEFVVKHIERLAKLGWRMEDR